MESFDQFRLVAIKPRLPQGKPVRLISSDIFAGCNFYYRRTVIRQRIEAGSLDNPGSLDFGKHFPDTYLDRFMGLKSFLPNCGLRDDFIKRLSSHEQINFKQLLLEAILCVENAVNFARHELSTIGYAAIKNRGNYTDLIWATGSPDLSRLSYEAGLAGLLELIPDNYAVCGFPGNSDFHASLQRLLDLARRRRLSPTTAVLKLAATTRDIPCEVIGRQHLRLGEGKSQFQFYSSMASSTSITAQKICADKKLTNKRLAELRLPVPKQLKVGSIDSALKAADKIGFPIVIKPLKGQKGVGVTAGITSVDQVEGAFNRAHKEGNDVVVESFITGSDYRLLVINGKFVAALTRKPPVITGDGKSTVEQLIAELNAHPLRDGFRLFKVEHDLELQRILKLERLSLKDVPAAGRIIALRSAANVSTGGIPIDVTDQVHPDNKNMAVRAANGVGLNIAGIDFLTQDISRSYKDTGGAIIEMNARPGLCMHTWPLYGQSRNVAGEVIKLAFPANNDGRIPIAAITGDRGTGTVARYLDMLLRGHGMSVATALKKNAYVNGVHANYTEKQQRLAARLLLSEPDIDTLVATVSPRRVTKKGMQLEQCHVAVIMDKIKDTDNDLYYLGLRVIERATNNCFVVGASNQLAINYLHNVNDRPVILVSEKQNHPNLHQHINMGKTAVTTHWENEHDKIVLISDQKVLTSFGFECLDVGLNSITRINRLKKSLMYAIAAAYGLGLPVERISSALQKAPSIIVEEAV
jgi:cyanophycin synthetase